jgi:hypothetical protein
MFFDRLSCFGPTGQLFGLGVQRIVLRTADHVKAPIDGLTVGLVAAIISELRPTDISAS